MKAPLIFLLLLFEFQLLSSENLLKSADSAYQAQNYSVAINYYTQALENDPYSSPLYYNLGNAYFKNNELGKSIWAYHKAKKINPKDKDVQYNLEHVSKLTKDKIEQNTVGVTKWIANIFFGRGMNFWAYLAIAFAVLASLFYYLFKITVAKNKRSIFLMISFSSAFLLFASFGLAIAHKSYISNLSHGVVIEPVVKVRTSPNPDEPMAFELHEGAKFKYTETQGDWHRIELEKNEGWILKKSALLY